MNLTVWRPQLNHIYAMDAMLLLRQLPDNYLQTIITSPPYYALRNYGGSDGQIGLEDTPQGYIQNLVNIFREARRALRDDGSLWLNLGDTYAGSSTRFGLVSGNADFKNKDLMLIPHRVAMALQADGWYLRSNIIWHKPNGTPESVKDRPTNDHEHIFLLTKNEQYYYDIDAIREPMVSTRFSSGAINYHYIDGEEIRTGSTANSTYTPDKGRNKRTVWSINTKGFSGGHFAAMPEKLIEPCVRAGSPENGIVYDPFMGAGTVGLVAMKNGRQWLGSELNPEYAAMANKRIADANPYDDMVFEDGSKQLSLFSETD